MDAVRTAARELFTLRNHRAIVGASWYNQGSQCVAPSWSLEPSRGPGGLCVDLVSRQQGLGPLGALGAQGALWCAVALRAARDKASESGSAPARTKREAEAADRPQAPARPHLVSAQQRRIYSRPAKKDGSDAYRRIRDRSFFSDQEDDIRRCCPRRP